MIRLFMRGEPVSFTELAKVVGSMTGGALDSEDMHAFDPSSVTAIVGTGPPAISAVLVAWIRYRKGTLKAKVTRKDGSVVELEATRVDDVPTLVNQVQAMHALGARAELTTEGENAPS
ncbi:hypothetical protein NE236_18990 [Actinoallomurus purpureus]|uniref:effector-associated constant component EACC1 n=1 Tax=Actinoallomurus purpureus TaxID=478114 RepID=UPI0020927160|nr:hypothetical protein [Actinoallomurus purpureus]MCO6007073.1 hypothetical protein [Actinoallomurus purpureus]